MEIRFKKPTKVWVNAPSKNNPYYKYHGWVGLAFQEINTLDNLITTVYFVNDKLTGYDFNPLYLETNFKTNSEEINKWG